MVMQFKGVAPRAAAALALALFVSACAAPPADKSGEAAGESAAGETPAPAAEAAGPAVYNPPAGATAIGRPLTHAAQPMKLAALQADVAPHLTQVVLVEATAEAICQSKGCWMTVKDGQGAPIWVRWASGCGGEFSFPKDAAGRRVVVEGTLAEKEISAEDAEHIAGESPGMDAAKIAGKTFEINATSCVVLPQEGAAAAS